MDITREQFGILVKGMKAVYTKPSFIPDKDAFNIWFELLKDLDYETLSYAVKKHMQSEEKEPSVASIRKHALDLQVIQGDELNDIAAWGLVLKAMRNSAYHAEEEFAKLPPIIQRAVANPGQLHEWAISEDVDGTWMSVTQSNFMRTYRAELAKEKELRKLSLDLLKIAGTTTCQEKIQQTEVKELTVSQERELSEQGASTLSGKLRAKYDKLMQSLGGNKNLASAN